MNQRNFNLVRGVGQVVEESKDEMAREEVLEAGRRTIHWVE